MSQEKHRIQAKIIFFRIRGQLGERSKNDHFENMCTDFEWSFWICSDFGIPEHVGMNRGHKQLKYTIQDNDPKSLFVVTAPGNHITINEQIICQYLISHTWILHGNCSITEQLDQSVPIFLI